MKANTVKKILGAAVSVLTALAAVAAIFASLFSFCFMKSETYLSRCLTEDYYKSVAQTAENALLNATTSVVQLERDKLLSVIDYEQLNRLSKEYMTSAVIYTVEGNGSPKAQPYESDELRQLVYNTIKESIEASGASVTDEAKLNEESEEAYGILCGYMDSAVSFLPNVFVKLLIRVSSVVEKLSFINKLVLPCLGAVLVLTAVNAVLNSRAGIGGIIYKAVTPLWAASLISVMPFAVLFIYNLPSKLAVTPDTSLYHFASGMVNGIVHTGFFVTLSIFAACSVCYITGFVLSSFRKSEI